MAGRMEEGSGDEEIGEAVFKLSLPYFPDVRIAGVHHHNPLVEIL